MMALINFRATKNIPDSSQDETVAETRRVIRVSVVGFVTFIRVSVAVVTAEPYNILHVSVRFQLKETTVSASVTSCSHVRKHMITFRKTEFSIFPST